ncbi:MAG: hypothetical protein H0W27_08645 [Actinobacteria bacterium]|nr:hypothetical protein [Actinomycetota bacterium]
MRGSVRVNGAKNSDDDAQRRLEANADDEAARTDLARAEARLAVRV